MRTFLAVGMGFALVALAAGSGCTGGSFPPDADAGEGGIAGGGTSDSSFGDAPTSDGKAGVDAGFVCGQLGGTYTNAKACNTVSDCTTIAKGCYCGAQPVIGIARTSASAAQACETKVGSMCGLGCANSPGHVAEDGMNDADGGAIEVLCDGHRCHTVLQ